jgi:2-methylisocitrate lyase-like PEP mutase family enzyme
MSGTDWLDTLIAREGFLILPGAYDALSARMAAQAGARAVYMTGYGVVGASWGVPDIGLIGPEAMTERARAIASAVAPLPLIADGDNGHGGAANVARLVAAYEQAGASAIQLEDQVLPKRCGHMDGKEIVSLADAVAKIEAACNARRSPAFKIVARTDARAVEGLDEALRRGDAFVKAGADVLFIEAPQSEDELRIVARTFAGATLLVNLVEDGKTPWLSPSVLQEMGYRIGLYPITALLTVARTLQRIYTTVLDGRAADLTERMRFAEYTSAVGLEAFLKL